MTIKIEKSKKTRPLTKPKYLAEILIKILKCEEENDREKEHFWAIGLTSRNTIKYIELVSLGTLNASLVHPREVYRLAIQKNTCQLIVAHNHPSGDIEPSKNDIEVTHRLEKAGEILGIELIDHIIITKDKFVSFKGLRLLGE